MVNVPGVRTDLAVKFEDFGTTGLFLVLAMDRYDFILVMPWLEMREPWIAWHDKTIEVSWATISYREFVAKLLTAGAERHRLRPPAGNAVPQAVQAVEQSVESVSGAGNIVPRNVEETKKKNESASGVGNEVPHGVKKTSTRAEVSLITSRVDNKAPHSESETPPARPVEEQCHVFDGVSGRQVKAGAVHLEALSEVSALLNLEK
ncbi:Pol protein [Phytophthora palmivora]|uniref:Pol protein n=1 Tax=Phytophthora palmivora TaxID=4796 RepID=A0A2P4YMF7_9STRA|nr:Pol protein [Phytophthora palmivora]